MVINSKELLDAVAVLTDERNMRVTLKHSAKGAVICGTACFIGGVLGGPIGLAVGGTIGGCTAAYLSKGQFKPVSQIILQDMTDRQREKLVEHLRKAIQDLDAGDLVMVSSLIMGNALAQQAILRTVTSFITNEMNLQIVE